MIWVLFDTKAILDSIIYIFPAYVANAAPVIFGGGAPLDLGKRFIDGKRIFGDHKTIRGLVSGIICGILAGILLSPFTSLSLMEDVRRAILLSIGAHLGDLLGSFIKRRISIPPGGSLPVMDQIGFLIFSLAITLPFYPLPLPCILFLVLVTLILHPLTNILAYLLKLKEKPY
ncbi:MAG: CDP-2,3-bis-(O-geranylgeranyl)-sn-glycerol synthase [Candidatus Njordarchaeales archaeon]